MRVLAVLALTAAVVAQGAGSRPESHTTSAPAVIEAGPMRLEVHLSRTAQVFHVVDQLSEWSEFCHRQYRRAIRGTPDDLTEAETKALEEHKQVRAAHGWSQGLEQTFYTHLGLDEALRDAVARGRLTAAEAEVERRVFSLLAPRIDRLIAEERPRLEAFRARLVASRDSLRAFAVKVSRFCNGAEVTVPVFPIANPDDRSFGGGYNGERITIELPRKRDAMPSFLHEAMHAFVATQKAKLEAALRKEPALDYQTLNEGIAYGLAPGIHRPPGETDPLAAEVAEDLRRKATLVESLVRFRRFGLALRPLLREALDSPDQTIDGFLPRALDAWRVMKELDAPSHGLRADGVAAADQAERPASDVEARAQAERQAVARELAAKAALGALLGAPRRPDQGQWFSAGPGYEVLADVARARSSVVASYNHSAEHYETILKRAKPGARIVLLMALDHEDRRFVPGYEDLLAKPREEVDAMLGRGERVELKKQARGFEVVTLAAPTRAELEKLIRATKLLE